jgi:hypothetical protein
VAALTWGRATSLSKGRLTCLTALVVRARAEDVIDI